MKMKKITASLVTAMAIGTVAFAGGDIASVEPIVETPVVTETSMQFFVGIDGFRNNLELSGTDLGDSNEINFKAGMIGFGGRIYVVTGKLFDYDNIKYTSTTLNYDYFLDEMYGMTPYVGAQAGYDTLKIDGEDGDGMQYGLKVGLLYAVAQHHELEIGYKYSWTNAKMDGVYEAETISTPFIGYNFKF